MLERAEYLSLPGPNQPINMVTMIQCGQSAGKSWLTPQRLHATRLALMPRTCGTINTKAMPPVFPCRCSTFNATGILSRPVSIRPCFFDSHHVISMDVKMTSPAGSHKP